MSSDLLTISIIYEGGLKDQDYPRLIKGIANLRLLHEASDPETFLAQHQEMAPDLVLVDLGGLSKVPDWLGSLLHRLPRTEVIVCSERMDAGFLLQILDLRIQQFIPYPLTRENLEAAVRKAQKLGRHLDKRPGQNPNRVLVVTGTRGGVGISTVATNLALALAEQAPDKVVLVDLGRPFPAVGQFLNLKGIHTILDLIQGPDPLDHLFMEKILQKHNNLSVLLGSSDLMLDSTLKLDPNLLLEPKALGKVFTALRSAFNWVVVDLGFWADAIYFKVIQEADLVLLLTELTVPDLQNLGKIKALFYRWNLDQSKMKVVVNRYDGHSTLGLTDLEKITLQPAFITLPTDRHPLIEAINQGEPLAVVSPRSKIWRGIKKLATAIIKQSHAVPVEGSSKEGWLHRFFSSKG